MAKIIDFRQYSINFDDFYSEVVYNNFKNSELGRVHRNVPWSIFVRFYTQRDKRNKKVSGRPRKLSIRAGLAILFLQAYKGVSAKQLWEEIQQNLYYQYFIGIKFIPDLLKYDHHIIYRLKKYYALTLSEIKQLQIEFAGKWKSYIPDVSGLMMDATVFESDINWPVMIRLLDEVLQRLNKYRDYFGSLLNSNLSNIKYQKLHLEFKKIITQRRRSRKKDRQLLKKQVRLAKVWLQKVENQIDKLVGKDVNITTTLEENLRVIAKIIEQQEQSLAGEKVSHPIVSLYRPYVHGIYRGKAKSRVEYGPKFHMFKRGGLDWIGYFTNKNFNEKVLLEETIEYSKELFGTYPLYISADKIYPSRKNHKYLKELGIKSNFPVLGRPKESEKEQQRLLKSLLSRARNQIEGVFGNLKSHYYTQRVRYKSLDSHVLMIFLSLTISNSLNISQYQSESPHQEIKESA